MQKHGKLSVPRSIVIVVDDDPAIRSSLKFSLEVEGFAVRTFACGTELLDSSDARLGQCFVIDQKMAGMTGLDLIENCGQNKSLLPRSSSQATQPAQSLNVRP